MIKTYLWIVGFLLLVAAFVYVLADNLPDVQIPTSGVTIQSGDHHVVFKIEERG